MKVRQPLYSKEEFARLGDEIYQQKIRPQLQPDNDGKIVAIDIQTGEFEIGEDTMEATGKLYRRLPSAQPWVVRVGDRAVHRFGAKSLRKNRAQYV